jgi:hypothetical protein
MRTFNVRLERPARLFAQVRSNEGLGVCGYDSFPCLFEDRAAASCTNPEIGMLCAHFEVCNHNGE